MQVCVMFGQALQTAYLGKNKQLMMDRVESKNLTIEIREGERGRVWGWNFSTFKIYISFCSLCCT